MPLEGGEGASSPGGLPPAVDIRVFSSADEALRRQDDFLGTAPPRGPSLLLWQSPRALLAGPTDARLPSFDEARKACAEAGWPVAVRRGGGRVCPVSPGTLQVAISRPVAPGFTIDRGYEEMASLIDRLLARLGLEGERGPCPDAFCPGRYDIAVAGSKVAGLAQAWRRRDGAMIAIVGASIVVDEPASVLAEAVNLFYRRIPASPHCRAGAVGSLSALARHPVTVRQVLHTLEETYGQDGWMMAPSAE